MPSRSEEIAAEFGRKLGQWFGQVCWLLHPFSNWKMLLDGMLCALKVLSENKERSIENGKKLDQILMIERVNCSKIASLDRRLTDLTKYSVLNVDQIEALAGAIDKTFEAIDQFGLSDTVSEEVPNNVG